MYRRGYHTFACILVVLAFLFLIGGWIASFSSNKTLWSKPDSFYYSSATVLFLAAIALYLGIAVSGVLARQEM